MQLRVRLKDRNPIYDKRRDVTYLSSLTDDKVSSMKRTLSVTRQFTTKSFRIRILTIIIINIQTRIFGRHLMKNIIE